MYVEDARMMQNEIITNLRRVFEEKLSVMNDQHARTLHEPSMAMAKHVELVRGIKPDKPTGTSTPSISTHSQKLPACSTRRIQTPRRVINMARQGSESDGSDSSMAPAEDTMVLSITPSYTLARDIQKSIGHFS